ncbi:MAG: 16S rRNA (guanine(527)-N(7))-methyltransferase RsmG [Roseobacter sp.]
MNSALSCVSDVSRETLEDLKILEDLIKKWTVKINLISKSSVSDLWNRHIMDSLQLSYGKLVIDHWVDIGSGGGFPGLVLAIVSKKHPIARKFTLIESDQRKCAFLREAKRVLSLDIEITANRIEKVPPQNADVLSARALADLDTLLGFAERHLSEQGVAFFPKGARWQSEVQLAEKNWSFHLTAHKSITDPDAAILEIKDIRRA